MATHVATHSDSDNALGRSPLRPRSQGQSVARRVSSPLQEITLTRRLVRLRDVKLAALVGDVKTAPVGYLQLSGFSKGAAKELAEAYRYLDSNAVGGMRGVILDLRGNPGEARPARRVHPTGVRWRRCVFRGPGGRYPASP